MRLFTMLLVAAACALLGGGCGDDETTALAGPPLSGPASSGSAAGGAGGVGTTASAGGMGMGGGGGSGGSGGSITMTTCNGNTCDIVFSGTGFGMHDGKVLEWGLQQQGQMGLLYNDSMTIAGGAFSFSAMGVTTKGTSYFVNYYVDIDADGLCTVNQDAIWRIALPNVQTHLAIDVVYDETNMANLGCSGLN